MALRGSQLVRPSGIFPQSLGGVLLPRDVPTGVWVTTEYAASATIADTVPQCGTHAFYELQLRGDTAATVVSLQLKLTFAAGQDTTTTSYHWQQAGGSNGAAVVTEGNTFVCGQIAAGTAVAAYYSPVFVNLWFYRVAARQRQVTVLYSAERAALDQVAALVSYKRQAAAVGTLVDPIQGVEFSASAGNIAGTVRRRIAQ